MANLNLIAMDYGASNGVAVLGQFDGKKIHLEELHRFPNGYYNINGISYWDTIDLYRQILVSLDIFRKQVGTKLDGIGIDTWGVDYGLIDKNGQICGMPIAYRHAKDADMEDVWNNVISKADLFSRTGLAANNFNTIYQLYARRRRDDVALDSARHLLLLPDLFAYMLSGSMGSEYTAASTTQLLNPHTKNWDNELMEMLGLDSSIFLPVTPSATKRGVLLEELAGPLGINRAPVIAVGGHDTASAVAAVPAGENSAFLSSGTWSLFGTESDDPIITDAVYNANYSNEGTIQGGFRPLKNIMGLWAIQQLRREWIRGGKEYSWDDMVNMAKDATPFKSLVDLDHNSFFAADNMSGAIAEYCRKTGQSAPETHGEFARCVYESLALKYRWAIERLEEIRGRKFDSLNIVGGGCQNKFLNQITANALGRLVITGPVEGASIGNLLTQAMALGEIANIQQLRQVVENSFDVEEYTPENIAQWNEQYGRFLGIITT